VIGRTIGKYRIVGQLGRGGMGTVYRAVDETLDREVAIKVLNPELADSDIMKRFHAEATTLAKLNHPEIATIYELFRSETDLLMVMEFVRGETLDKLSDRLGPFAPDRAAYLIDKVLSALEHAHRAGIVHRDIKPANVMVTAIGGVKIMDFGIARVRGAEHMTVDGYMMGTPAYMPPEQVLGQEVDGRADLYAVGVVFYRLLTGTLPFKADTAIGMVQKQISDVPTPLHTHRADLPEWCETIVQRALAKSPADRFQTAEEFRSTLGKATGMVTIEHTRAFSSADLETTTPPQPIKLPHSGLTPLAKAPDAAPPPSDTSITVSPAPAPNIVAPTPDGATIVLRTRHFAVAGSLLAVLAIGVAALAYVALRRPAIAPAPSDATVTPAAATTPAAPTTLPPSGPPVSAPPAGSAPPVAAPTAVPAPTSPQSTASGAPVGTRSEPIAPASRTERSTPVTPKPATPARGSSATAAASAKPGDAPTSMRMFQPMVFDARAFVVEDGRPREVDAQVVLSDGRITVTANDRTNPLHDVTYESVQSINYSRGRDPLWSSPEGPATVARASGGTLGIFRGERHWVSLRTNDRFLVMRLGNNAQVQRALAALQERTGRPAVLVLERKDAK
jgi:serine/threonine-protein kinase